MNDTSTVRVVNFLYMFTWFSFVFVMLWLVFPADQVTTIHLGDSLSIRLTAIQLAGSITGLLALSSAVFYVVGDNYMDRRELKQIRKRQ